MTTAELCPLLLPAVGLVPIVAPFTLTLVLGVASLVGVRLPEKAINALVRVTMVAGFAASIGTMIKKNIIYDRIDGQVMGLEGDELTMPDPATTKPDLGKSHVASGGRAEIVWPKGPFSAIKLEVDRHDTLGVRFLAVDTEPNYIDTVRPAAGQSGIYGYRGIYLLGDEEFGQWSDWVELAMRG